MSDQYGRSMIEDDFPRQRAKNRELSERLDRMEQDRDEQVKRLAEAIARAALPSGQSAHDWMEFANRIFTQGARVPDPPRPSLPVVSEEAVAACNQAYWNGREGREESNGWKAALRAAFPLILRETMGAHMLRARVGGLIAFHSKQGATLHLDVDQIEAIEDTLTGEAK